MTYGKNGRSAGFTLIELMIVVAMIAVLSAIAFPQYASYIAKARRTDARTAVLGVAARQEQIFSMQNRYSVTAGELGYPKGFPADILSSGKAYYTLNVKLTNPDGTKYLAWAVPIGPQASDKCGTYEINEQGIQTNSGKVIAECW